MTTRNKTLTRLEGEVEKARLDSNWGKIQMLSKQLGSKVQGQEEFLYLISGECELEMYLLENQSGLDDHVADYAADRINTAQRFLRAVAECDELDSARQNLMTCDVNFEAKLLLAKLHSAAKNYDKALDYFLKAELESFPTADASPRLLKMLAEAFCIKARCLETGLESLSKSSQLEREAAILTAYHRSAELCLRYLQDMEYKKGLPFSSNTSGTASSSNLPSPTSNCNSSIGFFLEHTLQSTPTLLLQKNMTSDAIVILRKFLRLQELSSLQSLRQLLSRQLAEVLLRAVCEQTYSPPDAGVPKSAPIFMVSTPPVPTGKMSHSRSQSLQLKLRSSPADGSIFHPQEETEEALILLLISESIVSADAVLSRLPEHDSLRDASSKELFAVYDLLTIALIRRWQYHALSQTFDKAMRFSFNDFHLWYQFGLSLIAAGKFSRGLKVLRNCCKMEPSNLTVHLLAAKLCYQLQELDEGIMFSKAAVETASSLPPGLLTGKSFLNLGMGYSLKADIATLHSERQDLQRKALTEFHKALKADENSCETLQSIAMQLAICRQIPESIEYVRRSLRLKRDNKDSLHLLVLLLSSQKQYMEAVDLLNTTINEYPDDIGLLMTLAKLKEVVYSAEDALHTCQQMLKIWKQMYDSVTSGDGSMARGSSLIDKLTSDRRSLATIPLSDINDLDTASMHNSVAPSRMEMTLSERGSSFTSCVPRMTAQHATVIQAQIWFTIATVYLSMDKHTDANACVKEADNICPMSHEVFFMRGFILENEKQFSDAKECYESALAICPNHVKSMHRLGLVLHNLENDDLAEKILRDAVNLDPTHDESWYDLGKVLQCNGDVEAASDCFMMALELESTKPILPFSTIGPTLC